MGARVLASRTVLKIYWRTSLEYLGASKIAEEGLGLRRLIESPRKDAWEEIRKRKQEITSLLFPLRATEILLKDSDILSMLDLCEKSLDCKKKAW